MNSFHQVNDFYLCLFVCLHCSKWEAIAFSELQVFLLLSVDWEYFNYKPDKARLEWWVFLMALLRSFFGDNNISGHICLAVYLGHKKLTLHVMEHQTTISLMVLLWGSTVTLEYQHLVTIDTWFPCNTGVFINSHISGCVLYRIMYKYICRCNSLSFREENLCFSSI